MSTFHCNSNSYNNRFTLTFFNMQFNNLNVYQYSTISVELVIISIVKVDGYTSLVTSSLEHFFLYIGPEKGTGTSNSKFLFIILHELVWMMIGDDCNFLG